MDQNYDSHIILQAFVREEYRKSCQVMFFGKIKPAGMHSRQAWCGRGDSNSHALAGATTSK